MPERRKAARQTPIFTRRKATAFERLLDWTASTFPLMTSAHMSYDSIIITLQLWNSTCEMWSPWKACSPLVGTQTQNADVCALPFNLPRATSIEDEQICSNRWPQQGWRPTDLFSCRFRKGISFPNFVERSMLKLLCAVPLALQNRALFKGEKRAKRCREKGRKRGGQHMGRKGKKDAWKQVSQTLPLTVNRHLARAFSFDLSLAIPHAILKFREERVARFTEPVIHVGPATACSRGAWLWAMAVRRCSCKNPSFFRIKERSP